MAASLQTSPSWFVEEQWRQYEGILLELTQGELDEIPDRHKNFLRQRGVNERQMYELVDYLQSKLQKGEDLFPLPVVNLNSSSSNPLANVEKIEKKLTAIALKLLEEERKYLEKLEQLDGILKPKILKYSPPADVKKLLNQTEALLQMTRTFYGDLDRAVDPTLVEFEELAQIIVEFSHPFKMYHPYAQAYPEAKRWFQAMKESRRKKIESKLQQASILDLIKSPITRPENIKSSISHMYKLSHDMDPESDMTSFLKMAFEELSKADELRVEYNKQVARREVVLEVQKQFSDILKVNFIDSHRMLVKEGEVTAIENSNPKDTKCFLFTDQIAIAMKGGRKGWFGGKEKKFTAAKLISFTVRCHCGKFKSEPNRFWVRSNHFVIHNQKKANEYRQEDEKSYQFVFEVSNESIRDGWVNLIKSCLPSVATLGRKKYELLLEKESSASLKALMLELGIKDLGNVEKLDIVRYIAGIVENKNSSTSVENEKLREQAIRDVFRRCSSYVPVSRLNSSDPIARYNSLSEESRKRSRSAKSLAAKSIPKRSPVITPAGPAKPRRRVLSRQDLSSEERVRLPSAASGGAHELREDDGPPERKRSMPMIDRVKEGEGADQDDEEDVLGLRMNSEELYGDSKERAAYELEGGDITTPDVINLEAANSPSLLDEQIRGDIALANADAESLSLNVGSEGRRIGSVRTEEVFLRDSQVDRMHENNELVHHNLEGDETRR